MWLRMVFVLALMGMVGCSSTRSTLLHRGECDNGWEKERLLHGVPITLQVPTHLKVEVVERHYLALVESAAADAQEPEIDWFNAKSAGIPVIRSVRTELIKTAKIFTVDPKRPAAGTMDTTLKFGGVNGQYFDDIDYFVEDKTIEAITGLLGKVAKQGLIGAPTAEGGEQRAGKGVDGRLHPVDSVVASRLFSLDAPDFEQQLAAFLKTHLNGCHTCKVLPPGAVRLASTTQIEAKSLEDPCSPWDAPCGCIAH